MKPENNAARVVVVGGSGAIGEAIVSACAVSGFDVIATYHRTDRHLAGTATWLHLDVTDQASIARTFHEMGAKKERPVFGLVYCAGVTVDAPFVRLTAENWELVLKTNLTGAFLVTQAAVGSMMLEGCGRIIYIGSISSRMGVRGQANYVASKAGLEGLCRTLSEELGPFGISTNVIAAGPIDSPMISRVASQRQEEVLRRIPMRRFGTREEIAKAVVFLLSKDASFINGQTISVDGGLHKL